jgi:protein gp37
MTGKSKIQWTDATWNPLAGCSIVSPGCTNCYAMRQAARIERMGGADHYVGLTEMVKGKPVWTGRVALASEKTLLAPLRWKKPRKIFVNSMSDLFHESVPDEWIDKIFAVMALAPQHTFQVLTKRSKRMRGYMCADRRSRILDAAIDVVRIEEGARAFKDVRELNKPREFPRADTSRWPLPNVWLGVTAEDQTRADERIPDLLATPAAVRFVSCEPMLGAVAFHNLPLGRSAHVNAMTGETLTFDGDYDAEGPRLDWVICGGESGPGARPMHPDWARSLRDQCRAAGTPFFFKQWGEWEPREEWAPHTREHMRAIKIDGSSVPDDVAPQDVGGHRLARVGKLHAGRLLDGREHNDFPEGK